MRHFANVDVGVATHTGRVRRANEDDFLLCAPQSRAELERTGWWFAIADGMGGAAGGAEASRTAVRAAVRPFLGAATNGDPRQRMRAGFDAAVAQVHEIARTSPNLRGMGTTLTIVNLLDGRLILGHVGDTRCVRVREGLVEQLSEDHAVREPDNYLTRCIGAGQSEVQADIEEFALQAGDRFVLMTDGVWSIVSEAEIGDVAGTMAPQDAAGELVRRANENGGPDNSTVIVFHVRDTEAVDEMVEDELPAEELPQPLSIDPSTRSLMPARWPWVVLCIGLLLLAIGAAKVWFEFDVFDWLLRRVR